jgi:hypothetical protein
MNRFTSILIMICVCLMFGMADISYAESLICPASMQEHVEELKLKKPKKYQTMVEKTQGNIKGCVSCHDDIGKKKKPSNTKSANSSSKPSKEEK